MDYGNQGNINKILQYNSSNYKSYILNQSYTLCTVFSFWACAPRQMQPSAGQTHSRLFSVVFELYHMSLKQVHINNNSLLHI